MGLCELSDVLFPGIELRVERVYVAGRSLFVDAIGTAPPGRCPDCGNGARRVHSRYWRRLADRPVGGREVFVRLRVRRFLCDIPMCRRQTFVEQVEGFTRSHGQSSLAMRDLARFVAVELGAVRESASADGWRCPADGRHSFACCRRRWSRPGPRGSWE
ncbi:transposase family protein [Streptomyces erythrochromogenes]|uniref:transposase family protein n=1 Tax=Streptomyces erythrochromogenes TaxID=285574 RepID=UPI0036F4DD43